MRSERASLIFLSTLLLGVWGCQPVPVPTERQAEVLALIRSLEVPPGDVSEHIAYLQRAKPILKELHDYSTDEVETALHLMARQHLPRCEPYAVGVWDMGGVSCLENEPGTPITEDADARRDLRALFWLNRLLFDVGPEDRLAPTLKCVGQSRTLWPFAEDEDGRLVMSEEMVSYCPVGEPPAQPIAEFHWFRANYPRRDWSDPDAVLASQS